MTKRKPKHVWAVQLEDTDPLDIVLYSTVKGVLEHVENWLECMDLRASEIDGELMAFEAGLTKSDDYVAAHGICARRFELVD